MLRSNRLAALHALFPSGGGIHPEVINDFPLETALFYLMWRLSFALLKAYQLFM